MPRTLPSAFLVCRRTICIYSLLFVGLVSGHDLPDEFVDAARVLELDLATTPVEVLQLGQHRDVAVQSEVETFQLVAQLLTHV